MLSAPTGAGLLVCSQLLCRVQMSIFDIAMVPSMRMTGQLVPVKLRLLQAQSSCCVSRPLFIHCHI